MNENIINKLGSQIHKLRAITVSNNHSDDRNLDLLVQNLMSIQQMIIDEMALSKVNQHLSILEKEAKYFLTRYGE